MCTCFRGVLLLLSTLQLTAGASIPNNYIPVPKARKNLSIVAAHFDDSSSGLALSGKRSGTVAEAIAGTRRANGTANLHIQEHRTHPTKPLVQAQGSTRLRPCRSATTKECNPSEKSSLWNLKRSLEHSFVTWDMTWMWRPVGIKSSFATAEVPFDTGIWMLALGVISCISYPALTVAFLMTLALLVAKLMNFGMDKPQLDLRATDDSVETGEREIPMLQIDRLPWLPRRLYQCWRAFCRCIPCIFVCGIPALLAAVARLYPQETYSALAVLTTTFVFSNGLYMLIFGYISVGRMREVASTNFPGNACEIMHWVVIPQYEEDIEIVSETLRSISRSCLSQTSICVLLAMENRDRKAQETSQRLIELFTAHFKEISASFHPAGLPNDPPGKASNVAWAYKHLSRHPDIAGLKPQSVLVTVADADSEFHENYFEGLTHLYLKADARQREYCIWQAPVLHLKNYHRQPAPVAVGSVVTCIQELASMSDPFACRFPYSTYSLPLKLAHRIGGWDADWIAEDWHMAIKCFLLTHGESYVEPLLLPTVNYAPEDDGFWSTMQARWAQAKRHALGFSDLSYIFMMLPLVLGHYMMPRAKSDSSNTGSCWRMWLNSQRLVFRLVNVHVLLGVLLTYDIIVWMLWNLLSIQRDPAVDHLVHRVRFFQLFVLVFITSCLGVVTFLFVKVYNLVRHRLEGTLWPSSFGHWLYITLSFFVFGPWYFLALGIAAWKAAFKTLFCSSFEYEVALKPSPVNSKDIEDENAKQQNVNMDGPDGF